LSSRQKLVILLSAEAEFIAATHALKEACWLCIFIGEVFRPLERPITVYCDNQSALIISKNNKYQGHTKHINI
jgi:hypothetical protein